MKRHYEHLGIDEYDVEAWIAMLESVPIESIKQVDHSRSYDMARGHLFKLENGKYATVFEEGCSCYTPENAQIELFPTLERALDSFKRWDDEQRKDL